MEPLGKGMTLSEADKIVRVYGRYIEYCSHILSSVFIEMIPESFLPFPKDVLEKALNIVAKHYHNTGDIRSVNLIREVHSMLAMCGDDEEALLIAAKQINDSEHRKKILLPVLLENSEGAGRMLIAGLDK